MELQDIDLNQLLLFHHLMTERRVARVAERLGITQPAVSNSLARLRRQFGDELFLRTPAGMVPTPFAEQLAEPVGAALALLRDGLNPPTSFDPAREQRALTLGMTDIGEIVFLPRLIERIGREAPGVTLSTVRNHAVNLQDDMAAGRVDLAIGLLPQLKAGFHRRRLFSQPYVCLFRAGHALDRSAKKPLTLDDFRAAEHLVVVSAGTGHGKVDAHLKRAGVERRVRLTVPHFVGVGHILQASDLVATVPQRLAQQLAGPFGLVWRDHPVALPDAPISLHWHAKVHRSAASQWLRGLVIETWAEA